MFSKTAKTKTKVIDSPLKTSDHDSHLEFKATSASIIGTNLTVEGNLESVGDIWIEGDVDGDISAQSVTLGEGASVKGCIEAQSVRIEGSFAGQVLAGSVILAKTAKATGDIIHQSLSIESGAVFEGQVYYSLRNKDELAGRGVEFMERSEPRVYDMGAGLLTAKKDYLVSNTADAMGQELEIDERHQEAWKSLVEEVRRENREFEHPQDLSRRIQTVFDVAWLSAHARSTLLLVTDDMADLRREGYPELAIELGEAFVFNLRDAAAYLEELVLLTTIAEHAAKVNRQRQAESYFVAALEQAIALNQSAVAEKILARMGLEPQSSENEPVVTSASHG